MKLFHKYDMFGVPPPIFNMGGRDKTGSFVGFISSMIVYVLMIAYSVRQGFKLLDGDPDTLLTFSHNNQVTFEEAIDLS